jgi:hypothetical protein
MKLKPFKRKKRVHKKIKIDYYIYNGKRKKIILL